MGKVFSDSVEKALEYIYYDVRQGKGDEGFKLLEEASAAGDGDASCILARCLYGYQYVWSGHNFPEDDMRAVKLYHKSVEQGSAIGVLVCLRSGKLTPNIERKMPFANLEEAFNEVLKKQKQVMLSANILLQTAIFGGILSIYRVKEKIRFQVKQNIKYI